MTLGRIIRVRNHYGSRALIALSCVFAQLLAIIAVMQSSWAKLVADGEAMSTKANLEKAASLFEISTIN
jgi:hypothetical protein